MNINGKKIFLGLIHGKAKPGHKMDTPERIEQSKIILNTFNNSTGPVIFGGDFNLNKDTESIFMLEKSGYKNLIKDYGIKETRNKLCWNQFPEEVEKFGKQHFADYCFVSPGVKVVNFQVPKIEASDHEPLILDFEI